MAHSKGTEYLTEFAGNYKVVNVKVDGGTGTTSTVTITGLSTVVGVQCTPAEAVTADAATMVVKNIADNVVTLVEYEDDFATACTQNAIDFYVTAIGY